MAFLKTNIINDFVWRIIFTLFKQGILFFIFLFAANKLSIDSFGTYNYVYSFIFLFTLLSDFGISTATSKYVAQNIDLDKRKDVIYNVLLSVFIFSLFLFIIILLFTKSYFGTNYIYILLMSPLIFLVPATSIYDGVYRGMKVFKKTAIISIISMILTVPFIFLLVDKYQIIGVIICQIIFYTLLLILYIFSYKGYSFIFDKKIIISIGKYSLVYGVAVLSYQIFARTDILFLGHYGFIKEIATYELINKLFSVMIIPFTLLGQVIAPRSTEIFYIKKDIRKLYFNLKKITFYTFLLSIVLGIFLYTVFPFFINSFFPKYNNNIFHTLFILNLVIFCINIMSATVDHGMVVATGHANIMSRVYIVLALLNILLNPILIITYGYVGSVYSTLICSLLMLIVLRYKYFLILRKEITNS